MNDQRIAFVITGGAAKGAYGAGVLKALAQAEIVPDLVVGSSSGALNGAFCAAYVAEDQFDSRRVKDEIGSLWTTQGSIWQMLRYSDDNTRALRNLFRLSNLLAPSLQFTSLASQQFLSNVLESNLAPLLERLAAGGVNRPVTLMISVSDLRGCPCRVAAECPQVRCRIADEADRPWISTLGLMITPAYVLNGRPVAVGVPAKERLLQLIAAEMAGRAPVKEAG